jgi:Bacterial protein of unknown function (DUF885)
VLALSVLSLGGCGEKEDWASFRDAFIEDALKADPAMAVSAGRHEFDGVLPDWSAQGIAAEVRRLHEARERAKALAGLDDDQRFERDYLVAHIDRSLFWLETAEAPFRNPTFYLGGLDPSPYLTREYAPLEQRMRATIKYARSIPNAAAQIRANLQPPLPKTFVQRGISMFGGFADFYENGLPEAFASVKDEALQKELAEGSHAAIAAMRELERWLEGELAHATQDYALGAEKFAQMLQRTERVATPLAELEALGRADLARNQQALASACERFAPGASLTACIARSQEDKPSGGPVQGAREQLAGLRRFIVDQNVVTIPSEQVALVAEAPPFNRANFAYIDIPGPYEKDLPSIYYIAPPDPSWSQEVQRDYLPGKANLLFTSVHEVWPGHFLNFLHAKRSGSILGRLFVGYAFAEGWAHYAEELMWEMGLGNGDPETHIGQISNALLRNARFISAIGLHTRGMSVAESERLFVEEAYQDVGSARQQAARGTYDPAYLNYTMGKLMIRKLRADWTATRGGRRAWREFHDRFLAYGGPPVPLVREAMLGTSEGSLF